MKKILLLKQDKQNILKLKAALAASAGIIVGAISFPLLNGIITVSATITAAIMSLGIGILTFQTILKKMC
ncbi:MAG: hypothetical protein ACRC41_17960 [Sarcina sp.]